MNGARYGMICGTSFGRERKVFSTINPAICRTKGIEDRTIWRVRARDALVGRCWRRDR